MARNKFINTFRLTSKRSFAIGTNDCEWALRQTVCLLTAPLIMSRKASTAYSFTLLTLSADDLHTFTSTGQPSPGNCWATCFVSTKTEKINTSLFVVKQSRFFLKYFGGHQSFLRATDTPVFGLW